MVFLAPYRLPKISGYESKRSQTVFYNSDRTIVIIVTGNPGALGENTAAYSVAYERYQPGLSEKTITGMTQGNIPLPLAQSISLLNPNRLGSSAPKLSVEYPRLSSEVLRATFLFPRCVTNWDLAVSPQTVRKLMNLFPNLLCYPCTLARGLRHRQVSAPPELNSSD